MPYKKSPTDAPGMPALLVIEQQKYPRRAMCRLLRAAGASHVMEATDIEAARRLLGEHPMYAWIAFADPDLIAPDGLEALKDLAASHEATSILLLSQRRAQAIPELVARAEAMKLPLIAALRKPFSAEEIGTLLRDLAQTPTATATPRASILTSDELSECLRAGRMRARFQPKLDLASGRPVGCEALPYVTHARHGDVPAARFSQAMAQLGAQRVMTASVLRDAANLVRSLRAAGLKTTVSVNLVPDVLSEPGDASSLDAYVRTLGIAPTDLALEIGTSAEALASPTFAENLARLKVRGYALAIDDAPGAVDLGDSTHAHFSELKLSWAALAKRKDDPEISKTVAATVTTARKYGMTTCAVGLETSADLDQVRRAGVELGQGDLFAASLAAEETLNWVAREEHARSFADHASPKRQRAG